MNNEVTLTNKVKIAVETQEYGTIGNIHTYTKRWADGSKVVYYTAEKNGVMSKRYWRRGNAVNALFAK
jgi:hypothetical protein